MKAKIDYKEITKLIDLLEERNLTHFELEVEGFKIKISKNLSAPSSAEIDSALSLPSEQEENPSQEITEEKKDSLHYITSPMVGTFYCAPNPTSTPFVDVGDKVKKNQTLCIIEAMKLMNEIESNVEGILEEIFVENGKPVEFGQKLFAIHLAS